MNREEFLNKALTENEPDTTKNFLIDNLEFIGGYFSKLRNDLLNKGFTVKDVWFGGRTQKDATFHYFDKEINFERTESSIIVNFNDSKFDTLKINGDYLHSEKYNQSLSEKLLDNYLELFF